jgi:3-phenylpropionate/trans-cinnamate dioxygenase ferredoxin reductase subunit
LVVGAGLIGTEVAAAALHRGVSPIIVTTGSAPLVRTLGPHAGRTIIGTHLAAGSSMCIEDALESLHETDDQVAVVLRSGNVFNVDQVIVAVGVVPNSSLASSAGVPVLPNGTLACDSTLTVKGFPEIMAVGDVATWETLDGRQMHAEHWLTASEHGSHAGANIGVTNCNRPTFKGFPFYWTEQLGLKVHVLGSIAPDAAWTIVEGDATSSKYVAESESAVVLVNSVERIAEYRGRMSARLATTQ